MAHTIEDGSIISGVVYYAAFREDDKRNAVPYVVAAIHMKKEVRSMTYNRLIEIANGEGRDI